MKPTQPCPQCGEIHEFPFSPRLLELFHEFRAGTREDKERLSLEIAREFFDGYNPTDETATEDYHEFFEDYEHALQQYRQQSNKLTRLAVHLIGSYLEEHGPEVARESPAAN